ncbi:flagellar protein FlaG [Desulfosporosinus sp. OT]|uniref:flagellar protein FlaG n=1 Tax=Desulfosporosinus sp. OT TaxID=913865 RepID=UPI001FA7BD7E|nr:flagellar protein FlaG [Desulfosporosinus sp. OT]
MFNLDIGAIQTAAKEGSAYATKETLIVQPVTKVQVGVSSDVSAATVISPDKVHQEPVKVQDVKKMTEAVNQFMHEIDTNIHFKYHEKAQELMVQVVDQATDKVIKEIPTHEFLDTIASIRSLVGILLDKKI